MAGDPQTTIVVPIQARYPAPGVTQMTFGRSTVCDIVLPIASVSKHHGFFETMAGVWLVSDAGSTNGTSVGGQRVQKTGVGLSDGCSLRLGRVLTQFLMPPTFCELLRQRLALERLGEARR
jgi:pSer/pThr/pTyr-binding forkhead associated (FHA) protein